MSECAHCPEDVGDKVCAVVGVVALLPRLVSAGADEACHNAHVTSAAYVRVEAIADHHDLGARAVVALSLEQPDGVLVGVLQQQPRVDVVERELQV